MDLMDRPRGHDWNESRNGSGPNSPDIYDNHRQGIPAPPGAHVFNPAILSLRPPHPGSGSPPNPPQTVSGNTNPSVNKPRIWSLADMASKENKDDTTNSPINGNSYAASMHGKILSPLAARGLHTLHHPYMRPDLYRNFYNPGGPHDAAILESYQRTFNAILAHNGIPPGAVPLSSMLKGSPFGPLSLTSAAAVVPSLNNSNNSAPQPTSAAPLPRASSPASSTSSTPEHNTPERPVATTPITPVAINVTKP